MTSPVRSEPRFDYAACPYPVRDDITEALRSAWERLAAPGS